MTAAARCLVWFLFGFLALVTPCCLASDATSTPPIRVGLDLLGVLRVDEPDLKLQFQVVDHPWHARTMRLVGEERGEHGFFDLQSELGEGGGRKVLMTSRVRPKPHRSRHSA